MLGKKKFELFLKYPGALALELTAIALLSKL